MSALATVRVGWCPGALAPMASGDGLIVRVKPHGGRLTAEQARAVALVSKAFGNGGLDLTARANLQVRGLREESLPDAVERLDRAGLLDPSPAAEAARNVVSSPLAGFDPAAIFDVRPAVSALEARLVGDAALHAVPAKFSFVVDDGGGLGLSDVSADIRFEAFIDDAEASFAVRLGGAGDEVAARCRPEDIAENAAALVHVFLAAREFDAAVRRMSDLVARVGVATVLRRAGLDPCEPPKRSRSSSAKQFIGYAECRPAPSPLSGEGPRSGDEGLSTDRPPLIRPAGHPGSSPGQALLPQVEKDETPQDRRVRGFLGVAAPFGRLTADQLQFLARKADGSGAAELRLTPWRAILVPGLRAEDAPGVAEACANAGLILDPGDPRLRVAACTGAPGCHRGTSPVLDHAAYLAARLGKNRSERGILLHVSGCGKGCAHAGNAPLTLVADNGIYNLVVDGRASDRPILNGVGFEEAAEYVQASARMERQA